MTPASLPSTASCTRRKLLGWGGAGAVAGLAGYVGWPRPESGRVATGHPVGVAGSASAACGAPVAESVPVAGAMGREAFLPHLHSGFQLAVAGGADTTCTLVEVSAARTLVSPTARFTSFALMFSAPMGLVAESQVYHLQHAQMGALELFLTPVGKSAQQVYLEAVFSQRV